MAVPIYRTQDWEAKTKQEQFGTTDLSRRQERKFNRYAKSNAGEAARLAFDKAEMTKFNDSVDKAVADQVARMRAAYPKPIAKPISKPATPTSSTLKPDTSSLVLKNVGYWNQIAGQYGFNDYNAVAEWQRKNGLEADGKFGQASYAKWAQLNPDKVGSVPVIKPKAATSAKNQTQAKTQVKPETPASEVTSIQPFGYAELSRQDGSTFLQRTPSKVTSKVNNVGQTPGFNFDSFVNDNSLESMFRDGKRYARYDPSGAGDFWVGEDGSIHEVTLGGGFGSVIHNTGINSNYAFDTKRGNNFRALKSMLAGYNTVQSNKQGGTMGIINYFQQGGAAPQQQDIKAQVTALVQAAMQGDQKATQTVNQIMEAAKAGDQQAIQIAKLMEQVVKELQGQATSAKWGTKLGYIRSLKYAKGGKTCPACKNGGIPETADKAYIKSTKKVEEKACGGKAKKKYFGGLI